jgi:hypothetical protein
MKFIITIDTEEDNWSRYSATINPVSNIERIVPLQELFDEYDVRPTYLITYPVATHPRSVEILKRILDEGKCEIGMHCHPWNTPPFDKDGRIRNRDTMLCNLPEHLVFEKLSSLHEAICRNFGIVPVSFRAGRWGFGPAVARALCKLGYQVDSSITPYTDWRSQHGPDYSSFSPSLFRFDVDGIYHQKDKGALLQVPATVGFLQKDFALCQLISKATENQLGRKLRTKGILDRLRLVNKVWLSPETAEVRTMMALAERMKKNKYPCINLFFHSTSLLPGLSTFVLSQSDEKRFIHKIRKFLSYSQERNLKCITLSEIQKNDRPANLLGAGWRQKAVTLREEELNMMN